MSPPHRTGIDEQRLDELLAFVQDGVVSRRQLLGLGADDDDIARLVRRGRLHRRHPGVLVEHNGPLTRAQREWVAVLVHWPAALTLVSALPEPPRSGVVHVAIDVRRSVRAVPGVVAHRTAGIDVRADWGKAPPRMRLEHVAVDLACQRVADPLESFRLLADITQTRRTSARAIADVLRRRRVPGKALLLEMLDDLDTGACSVLEREYLLRVERAHGLPEGRRQARGAVGGRTAYRDVAYAEHATYVELDGRAFHDSARSRDADAERDLQARVDEDAVTVRLTYGLVLGSPCRTAWQLAALLRRRGWTGQPVRCPRCPALDSRITGRICP